MVPFNASGNGELLPYNSAPHGVEKLCRVEEADELPRVEWSFTGSPQGGGEDSASFSFFGDGWNSGNFGLCNSNRGLLSWWSDGRLLKGVLASRSNAATIGLPSPGYPGVMLLCLRPTVIADGGLARGCRLPKLVVYLARGGDKSGSRARTLLNGLTSCRCVRSLLLWGVWLIGAA